MAAEASRAARQRSRTRLAWLIGALGVVATVYLCLPRSWFEVPSPPKQAPTRMGAPSGASPQAPGPATSPAASGPATIEALRAAADGAPLDFGARSRYGMALAAAGRGPEAIQEFRAAERLAPESPGVHHNLGVYYLNTSRPKDADAEFCRELELAPADGRAHYFRGLSLQAQHLDAGAIAQFRLATTLAPELPDPYMSLAVALGEKQPAEKTLALTDEYIRRGGSPAVADFVLSRAYRARHQYTEAARYAEKTVQEAPDSYSNWHNLGQIYSYARRTTDADRALHRALELTRDKSTLYTEIGMNAQNAERWQDAVDAFRKALAATPQQGNIHLYLASAYQRMGDAEAARREETVFRDWWRANEKRMRSRAVARPQ